MNTLDTKTGFSKKCVTNWIGSSIAIYSERKMISIEEARAQLEIALDVNSRQLGYWINNTTQPTIEQALKISEFLGRSVSEIFKLSEA